MHEKSCMLNSEVTIHQKLLNYMTGIWKDLQLSYDIYLVINSSAYLLKPVRNCPSPYRKRKNLV